MEHLEKIHAEAFDIMQYYYRSAHEPFIHCQIRCSHLDEDCLKTAVDLSKRRIPLIGCSFDIAEHCWRQQNFTAEEIVSVVTVNSDTICDAGKYLVSSIDIFSEPQLKIFLIRGQKSDTICFIMNHMICDGAGFKEYLYLLSNLYSKCRKGLNTECELQASVRSMKPLLARFTFAEKIAILFSKPDVSNKHRSLTYPLQGDKESPFIVTRCIPKDQFQAIKAAAKKRSATLNDMILTAYIRTLSQETGERNISIPCPVDLRKYISPDEKIGICNLTSNLICNVELRPDEQFEQTLKNISLQMQRQKSSVLCLKDPILLNFAFHALPEKVLSKLFRKLFTIPVLSYTNLGIINQSLLQFDGSTILDCFITGAIKYTPYFQISVSTYNDVCTLSCNMHGTPDDRKKIEHFLQEVHKELCSCNI